eukprot:2985658-Amphidinium_carterae.2
MDLHVPNQAETKDINMIPLVSNQAILRILVNHIVQDGREENFQTTMMTTTMMMTTMTTVLESTLIDALK